ncbi:MAG: FlgD immunoglobulin-like domain containing protein, partial [Candidatus Krumholzibacteriota bacterium]
VSDPTNPALLGAFTVDSSISNCVLQGGVAYVSSFTQGKQLDISDPTAITLIQDLPLISYQVYNRLDIHGSELVHVGSHNLGFVDFATGAVTRRSEQVGDVRDAAVIAGKIMAVGDDRLEIYDDGLHLNPTAGDVPEADLMEPQGIMLDNVLYGISEATGTSLMATELGGGLLWELPLDTQGYLVKAAVQRGNTVVTLASTGILSVVTASRYGAVLRGTLEFQDGFYSGFDGDRRIAFLDDQTVVALDPTIDRNIRVVDVSDPEQPAQIGRYPISLGSPTHITVAGSTVVVSSWYGYEVFDAQDRFSLQSLAVQAVAGAQYRIYATDSYVHALLNAPVSPLGEVGPERLDTWDISDPTAPVLVNQLNLASYGNLFFAGDWAYQGDSGLILDFSDPAHPVPAGNFSQPLPSNISWVTVVAGTEYIVADHVPYGFNPGRFAVYMSAQGATGNISAVEEDLPAPGTGLTLQAVPNPFNPRVTLQFELAVAGPTRVQVFDLRGRLVADLGEKHRQAGPQSVTWDGVDRQGRDLPSGVYLAQVSTPIGHASRKIVLAR